MAELRRAARGLRLFKWMSVLGAVVFSLATAVPGQALLIDFATGGAGPGGVLIDLGGGNYSGAGIPINQMSISGAPVGDGNHDVDGAFIIPAVFGGGTAGVLAFNTAANTITITGGIPDFLIPDSTVLLTGSFTGFTYTGPSSLGRTSFSATGNDYKDVALLQALQVFTGLTFEFDGFTLASDYNALTGTSTPYSTDIGNVPTPEPATLLLLGSGLVGMGWFGRKKVKGSADEEA